VDVDLDVNASVVVNEYAVVDVNVNAVVDASRGLFNRSVLVGSVEEECKRCLTLTRGLLFRLARDRNMVKV
jgi:hypothetical protein